VTQEWAGTRAGMAGYLLATVKEKDGMPFVEFNPGDLPPVVMARILELCLKKMIVEESVRRALQLEKIETPDGNMD
jgi:hypothetical protein